ncbi:MAG: hypothetical protein QF704_12255, partial [Anaerolineales bacterium]|nr:hypothetical protein [Anaerolineales bacterium]
MAINDYSGSKVLSDVSGLSESQASGWSPASSSLATGDLRRKYNFADKFTELSISQTPFFRIVAAIGKKPTDDPEFKYTEKRQSWMKRYGYVIGHSTNSTVNNIGETGSDATFNYALDAPVYLWMGADYKSAGNIGNVIGAGSISVGDQGTAPSFYVSNQIIKVNTSSDSGGSNEVNDYALVQISSASDSVVQGHICHTADAGASASALDWEAGALPSGATAANWYAATQVIGQVIKASDGELCNYYSDDPVVSASMLSNNSKTIANDLEPRRSYVVGNASKEGSTLLEENWLDNPYSTG